MTYNIRLDVQSDGENAWTHRKEFLASQIRFHAPHVLGTQEGLPHQIDWLDEQLLAYSRIGEGREGGHKGEYSAIYYDRKKLDLKESGTFWLSTTPDTVSIGWDAALPRIVTWGQFVDRDSDEEFLAFNTHFDHKGSEARINSVDLILSMMDSLNKEQFPVVMMGDFNLTPETQPIRNLSKMMNDAHEKSPIKLGPSGTFTGFNHEVPAQRRIDYIFVSPQIDVLKFATLTDAIESRYASDHFALVAELNLRTLPLIIAHRGASGYALENSLDAFGKAVEMNSDMIELDVFTLKDGNVVCFHDSDLKRLTGTKGDISEYTLEQLNQLTLLNGSRIPLLSEALKVVDKQLRINVELKGPGTAEPTYHLIQKFISDHGWKLGDFHISSFRHDELAIMRNLSNTIEIGILPHGDLDKAIEVGNKLNAYSINAYHGSLDEESVANLHESGFKIYAWTVNSYSDIQRLMELGIDGFITNYPDRVMQVASQ
ncbi:glycerophosphodiester phosphodiesterase family protein [Portibacter marinus]|uniref:glycerophosphodiester phosphodiesterase family protein n=1 Tax=Portibacter marinus TaxID=2898660 RepID=UPI001F1B8CBC|nr:glycerophosphodiester phosphodiesterase family protein [Portibacter marinus]